MEINHFKSLLSELKIKTPLHYHTGRNNFIITELDIENGKITVEREAETSSILNINFQKLLSLGQKLEINKPIDTEVFFGSSGNDRSVLSGLAANTSEIYSVKIKGRTNIVWCPQKAHEPNLIVLLNEKEFQQISGIKNNVSVNSVSQQFLPLLTAIRTKPFILLAGISGTGKSRIVRKLAQASVSEDLQKMYDPKSVEGGFNRWQLHKPANFELIQVKPNWHNSLEVVGYKSNIGGAHYEFTPFVEFVARAWKHPETPFFLCLDEMNLAPVEQYFAEFLSAIESRSIENNEYETDPIIKPFESFDADNDTLSDRMIAHLLGKLDTQEKSNLADRFRTKGLTLPQNLIILGTVNMDETTFSFSRKVLDRAMSIVMDDVDYESYFNGTSENNVPEMDEGIKQLIINRHINGLESKDNDAEAVKNYLTSINAILDKTPFKLGYRAANEALLYVSAAHSINSESSTKDALDEFTLMKILSRIEGDKRSIDNLLENLKGVITIADYPKSYEVLDSMSKTLNSKQFVSYWTK